MNKRINVGISKTDIGYFVDLHYTIIAGSYSPSNISLKDYTTDVETLNYALKPLNLEVVEKKIQKKPIYKDDGTGDHYYYCANCDSRVPLRSNLIDQIKYKHCPYCGNEIDWSDTNE